MFEYTNCTWLPRIQTAIVEHINKMSHFWACDAELTIFMVAGGTTLRHESRGEPRVAIIFVVSYYVHTLPA